MQRFNAILASRRPEWRNSTPQHLSEKQALRAIASNPDTVAAKVQELVDIGLNHLLVRFIGDWTGTARPIAEASMRLFAREIMPHFEMIPPLRDRLALDLSTVSEVPVT